MALSRASRIEQANIRGGSHPYRRLPPKTVFGTFQGWALAGLVGALLGLYVLAVLFVMPGQVALLVPAALFPFVAMIVGNLRRSLLAVILLDIPFALDIYLGYQTEPAKYGAIGGLNISATTIALAALYMLWIAYSLAGSEDAARPRWGASLPLAAYVGFAAVSVLVAEDTTLGLYEVALLVQMFLLYLYVVSNVRTRRDVLYVVTLLLLGVAFEGAVIVANQFVALNLSLGSSSTVANAETASTGSFSRQGGTLGSPVLAASFLSLLLACAIAVLMTKLPARYKWIAGGALGFGGIALVLTFTRGGWLGFVVSVALLIGLSWRRGWASLAVPLAVTLMAIVAAIAFQDAIVARLFNEQTAADRVPLDAIAFQMILGHPLLGVGANNFPVAMFHYAGPRMMMGFLFSVHDKYLLVWSETGTLAFLAFLAFLFTTLWRGWTGWKRHDRFLALLSIGLTAGVAGQMLHMLVDVFHSKPQVESLWLVAALITAISRMEDE